MAEGSAPRPDDAPPAAPADVPADVPANVLWAFSLAFYRRPGVSDACIALQDAHGADVDVLLFSLWCARRGHRLGEAELAAVDASVAPWRAEVVQPLRAARRALKPPPGPPFDAPAATALRAQTLTLELEAERLQHAAMAAQAPPPGDAPPQDAARHNLAAVARLAGIPADAAPLRTLLQAFG